MIFILFYFSFIFSVDPGPRVSRGQPPPPPGPPQWPPSPPAPPPPSRDRSLSPVSMEANLYRDSTFLVRQLSFLFNYFLFYYFQFYFVLLTKSLVRIWTPGTRRREPVLLQSELSLSPSLGLAGPSSLILPQQPDRAGPAITTTPV